MQRFPSYTLKCHIQLQHPLATLVNAGKPLKLVESGRRTKVKNKRRSNNCEDGAPALNFRLQIYSSTFAHGS